MPSFVQLQSDTNDFIGGGRSYAYDQQNALFWLQFADSYVEFNVAGDEHWRGVFAWPSHLTGLTAGTYIDNRGWPAHDPATGGFKWTGQSRACNPTSGWFIVDDVRYAEGQLVAFDIRFEQHCEGAHLRSGDRSTGWRTMARGLRAP